MKEAQFSKKGSDSQKKQDDIKPKTAEKGSIQPNLRQDKSALSAKVNCGLEIEVNEIGLTEEYALARERNLKDEVTSIFSMVPRKIHALQTCPETKEPLYLCSWQQDYSEIHYMPGWVQSSILQLLQYQNLIVEFYEKQLPVLQQQQEE